MSTIHDLINKIETAAVNYGKYKYSNQIEAERYLAELISFKDKLRDAIEEYGLAKAEDARLDAEYHHSMFGNH